MRREDYGMRILLMNHFPLQGSGSGVYTINIARALVRKGHEVCIIMPENEELAELETGGVRLHPVYFDSCVDEALDFDFPCFTTHPRSVTTFYELDDAQMAAYEGAFRAAIEDEIAAFDPDVIHCGHIWVQASYAADYGIPLVITAHGTDLIGFEKSERFREQAKKAFDTASAVIAISKDSAALVEKLFGDPEKVHLIQNGYDPTMFYPEACSVHEVLDHFGIEGDYDSIVSFAGKFTYFKGIDILLNATALYERDGVATLLAGDGELFDEMTALGHPARTQARLLLAQPAARGTAPPVQLRHGIVAHLTQRGVRARRHRSACLWSACHREQRGRPPRHHHAGSRVVVPKRKPRGPGA